VLALRTVTRFVFLALGTTALACGGRIETLTPQNTVVQASGTQLEPDATADGTGSSAVVPELPTDTDIALGSTDNVPGSVNTAGTIAFVPPANEVATECSATLTLYSAGNGGNDRAGSDGREGCRFTVLDSVAIEGLALDAAVLAVVDPETQSELLFTRLADATCNTQASAPDAMGWSVEFGAEATVALCSAPCEVLHSAPQDLVLKFDQGILCDPSNQIR
jgi:hypothetical protein